jgi:hypothetical protein
MTTREQIAGVVRRVNAAYWQAGASLDHADAAVFAEVHRMLKVGERGRALKVVRQWEAETLERLETTR